MCVPSRVRFRHDQRAFDGAGMDALFAVRDKMVDKAALVVLEPTIGHERVGINNGAQKDVGADMREEFRPR